MKQIKLLSLLLILGLSTNVLIASDKKENKINYSDYFTKERLRIDFTLAGNKEQQGAYLTNLKKEAKWAGSLTNLLDPFQYGEYMLKVISKKDGKTIYSKGFNTLFQEWRTTEEAKKIKKSYQNSQTTPFPKEEIIVTISERMRATGKYQEISRFEIDPKNPSINEELENNFDLEKIHYSGNPNQKVDLVFIAEGYTKEEMDLFIEDAKKFTVYLFDIEPYKSRKSDFNIWALKAESKESGTDIPNQGIWKNTLMNSNFYTFESDRYLTSPSQDKIAKAASNTPYDALYVIVNTTKYGGGGIYNFYGLNMRECTRDGLKLEDRVFVHELGHSFAGLADEYYNTSTGYSDFYNLKIEPWEPNITTLVNFESKWESMIDKKTPQPTPAIDEYMETVGLYEGGGYLSKDIYRPYIDCRMKTNTAKGFCPVCVRAINRMIDYYSK